MTRDMDLIRQLLLKLEAFDHPPGTVFILSGHDEEVAIEGYSADQIEYHLDLLREAGFVDSPGSQPMRGITFARLSWAGHDFLDSVRDPKIWAKTKAGATAAGGFTLDLLTALAKGFAKKQIEELTGVKLGLRDRALIALMVFSFARIGAAIGMKREDVYTQNRRLWVRLQEKDRCHCQLPAYGSRAQRALPGLAFDGRFGNTQRDADYEGRQQRRRHDHASGGIYRLPTQ